MSDKHVFKYQEFPEIEIDLLVLYYNFSDQWGNVDSAAASDFVLTKFGVMIEKTDFKLTQKHTDFLMDVGLFPDVRLLLNKIAMMPTPKKKRNKK